MESEWIRWISTAILGWIAYEMRGLRRDISHRVPYSDCNRRMDEHRDRLENMDERIRIHGHKIAAIEECHNRLNPSMPLATTKQEKIEWEK